VKNFLRSGKFEGDAEKDVFGNELNIPFKSMERKPIVASDAEVKRNPRSTSARMRIGEKL
jgi:16S rRNA (cytosine1402-N4)-methyltransferase